MIRMREDFQDYAGAKNAALRLLGRREHGRRELAGALQAKGFAAALCAEVVQELQACGLQSDERFAAALVRRRIERGYGPVYIRAELANRQVEETLADAQLNQPDQFWLEIAARALAKKFPRRAQGQDSAACNAPTDMRSRQCVAEARFLARRGFPAELVRQLKL